MKTKETNPTRPGSPTPCKQALSHSTGRRTHSSQQNLHFSGLVNFNTEGFLSLTKHGVDSIEQNQKESIYEPEEESATTLESYYSENRVHESQTGKKQTYS